jgi:hypothetical protein
VLTHALSLPVSSGKPGDRPPLNGFECKCLVFR